MMPSRYQLHVEKWSKCRGCELCTSRTQTVFTSSKSSLPCDVLFVGEAPGKSEDAIGEAFVGPAGHLMDEIIEQSCKVHLCARCRSAIGCCGASGTFCNNGHEVNAESPRTSEYFTPLRYAVTNLICCLPVDEDKGNKLTEPPDWAVEACTPRLQEFVRIADPQLIVAVGAHARDWLTPGYKGSISFHRPIPVIDIIHPGATLSGRMTAMQGTIARRRASLAVATEIKKLPGKKYLLGG